MAPTQAAKLGLRDGSRLLLDHAPEGWAFAPGLPDVAWAGAAEPVDVALTFLPAAAELAPRLGPLGERVRPAGALWIAWPRRAAGHRSDVTDVVLRELVLPTGMVDTKVAMLDEDWSALKFVWRLAERSVGSVPPRSPLTTAKPRIHLERLVDGDQPQGRRARGNVTGAPDTRSAR